MRDCSARSPGLCHLSRIPGLRLRHSRLIAARYPRGRCPCTRRHPLGSQEEPKASRLRMFRLLLKTVATMHGVEFEGLVGLSGVASFSLFGRPLSLVTEGTPCCPRIEDYCLVVAAAFGPERRAADSHFTNLGSSRRASGRPSIGGEYRRCRAGWQRNGCRRVVPLLPLTKCPRALMR